jgi:hypothetical protein
MDGPFDPCSGYLVVRCGCFLFIRALLLFFESASVTAWSFSRWAWRTAQSMMGPGPNSMLFARAAQACFSTEAPPICRSDRKQIDYRTNAARDGHRCYGPKRYTLKLFLFLYFFLKTRSKTITPKNKNDIDNLKTSKTKVRYENYSGYDRNLNFDR